MISPNLENSMAEGRSEQVLRHYGPKIMSDRSKEHRQVERVLRRLLPHSGLEAEQWEVRVIDADEKNAFVIPGGKGLVFRGPLNVCQGDEGLAAVLGHEIAHNVAHHAAERMSRMSVLTAIAVLTDAFVRVYFGLVRPVNQFVFDLPGSRKEEEEAVYIGLLMMAESCHNPEAAMGLWQRMESYEKSMGGALPQFLSTYPSSHARLEEIRNWLPKAQQKLEDGKCGTTGVYAQSFGSTMHDFARCRMEIYAQSYNGATGSARCGLQARMRARRRSAAATSVDKASLQNAICTVHLSLMRIQKCSTQLRWLFVKLWRDWWVLRAISAWARALADPPAFWMNITSLAGH
ncbi:hypothetical protein AC579_10139 [Pseudocercospora musae]|uniref:Peptidase M48 domain-containing protein n=1 Tax=Pseudocercospora musae TaxID=113226 RepID=A0A139IS22_9PEZI|nr:hypothetical protein AC579_10139 [Pseudocercospora musae]